MGFKVFGLFSLCAIIVTATNVDVQRDWVQDFGWRITCSWKLYSNDSLQSVRLYNNIQQFMIYRPEKDHEHHAQYFSRPENGLHVECTETAEKGVTGNCIVNLELYQPQKDDILFACEVSGERPFFRLDRKDVVLPALIMPTAVIDVVEVSASRVTLNCSSTGLPNLNLIWTIGDQKVPQTFNSSSWNVTSKLWNAWSLLSYTPPEQHLAVVCTPQVFKSDQLYTGTSSKYNSASNTEFSRLIFGVLLFLVLLR